MSWKHKSLRCRKIDNGGAYLGFSRNLLVASSERRVETVVLDDEAMCRGCLDIMSRPTSSTDCGIFSDHLCLKVTEDSDITDKWCHRQKLLIPGSEIKALC